MPLPQPRSSVLVAAAWVLACAAAVLAGVALTLAPAEQARAWPLPGPHPGLAAAAGPVAGSAAALAVLALVAAAGHARARGWEAPFAGLIALYPLLHLGLWFVLGAGPPGPAAWIVGALLVAGLAWLARLAPRLPSTRPRPAPRRWLVADLVMIAGPAVVGLAAGTVPDWRVLGLSALLYPLFAAVQLAVFLEVPARHLRTMGLGPTGTALACALVFGLVHWPHPAVFSLTAAAMFVWASARMRGRPFRQLAVVMGLAATTTTQLLPDAWTGHMNTGPRAVRQLAVADLAGEAGPGRVPAAAWLRGAYPRAVGRPLGAAEADAWRRAVARELRANRAWEILLSTEYARLAAAGERPAPPPLAAHWSDLPAPWPERLAAAAAPDSVAAAGGPDPWLAGLYRAYLGRTPAPAELARWRPGLLPVQRARLARLLLENRLRLADAPFASASFPALRLPRQ